MNTSADRGIEPSGHPHHPEGFCTVASCDYSKALLAWMRGEAPQHPREAQR